MTYVKHASIVVTALAAAGTFGFVTWASETTTTAPLQLETTISLGAVVGRVDHLAVDLGRQRLFVAQLGDNTVSVVDLRAQRVINVIRGLSEPQGVAYIGRLDTLFVTNGGDGSVRLFSGPDYEEIRRIELGNDADNIRVDTTGMQVFVGYGNGKLAALDTGTHAKTADIQLKGHPESFQLDPSTSRVFVNVPTAREVAVLDYAAGRQTHDWPLADGENFPLALDLENRRALVVFRNPAMLSIFSMRDGSPVARVPTCGDSDDVFVDAARGRVYVSCGEGAVDVFRYRGDTYERIAQIATFPGARTSLFVPELDRLFVAARMTPGHDASVLVFKPDQSTPLPASPGP